MVRDRCRGEDLRYVLDHARLSFLQVREQKKEANQIGSGGRKDDQRRASPQVNAQNDRAQLLDTRTTA